MIEITFSANSVPELVGQMRAFVFEMTAQPLSAPSGLPEPAKPRGRPRKEVLELGDTGGRMGHLNDETGEIVPPVDYGEMVATANKTANALEAKAASTIKDLLSVKDKTIAVLQKAMADGKIDKLRALLTEYGDGAKSFPEVAPEKFPEIAKALQNGALT